jgi:hypothetical protein
MQKALAVSALVALCASPLVSATDADARQSRKSPNTLTVCSKSGFDCYTAGVRHTRVGKKLVLRGGATLDCDGDCRDVLRAKTVDFWEDRMLNGG